MRGHCLDNLSLLGQVVELTCTLPTYIHSLQYPSVYGACTVERH